MMSEAKKPSLKEKFDNHLDREFHNPIPGLICGAVAFCKKKLCGVPEGKPKEKNNV